LPEVGEPISKVVEKAMARDREHRYPSALAMHAALETAYAATLERGAPNALPPLASAARAQTASERTIRRASTELASTLTEPKPRASKRSRKLAGAAIAAGVGLLAMVWLARGESEDEGPRYIVVQGAGEAGSRPSEPPPSVPAKIETPQAEPPPVVEASAGKTAPEPPRKTVQRPAPSKKPAEPPAPPDHGLSLTRAFERQKAAVVRCLSKNPEALPEHGELAVRISLDVEGRVVQASVTPQDLAQSEAGSCVASATKAMQFGKQPGPVVFRVPLTTRRH
jgi:hypothetical protein